jgi:hypothetical protein
LDEVIKRMLSIDPTERYPSNKDAVASFTQALQGKNLSRIRVFVSFSHEDIRMVKDLVLLLEQRGFAVWWDAELSHTGDWDDQIEAAMLASQVMVVFLSDHSVRSNESKREWKYWLDHVKKPIIPVILEDCRPPYRLSPLQAIVAKDKPVAQIASDVGQAILKTFRLLQETREREPPIEDTALKTSGMFGVENVSLRPFDVRSEAITDDISTKVPAAYSIGRPEMQRCLESTV